MPRGGDLAGGLAGGLARVPARARGDSRRAALLVGLAALVLFPDCGGMAPPGDSPATPSDGIRIGAAAWRLTWNREGATLDPGGGFSVTSDLGYRVHVARGRFVSHSVSLGACAPAASPATSGGAGARLLGIPFSVRSAFAHEDKDPSQIELSLDEDLAAPTDQGTFEAVFPEALYCRVHWLVAIPGAGPGGIGTDITQLSIEMSGTFERDGERSDFAIRTWWPEGRLVDLATTVDAASLQAATRDQEARRAKVTVERRLSTLFDGIDFSSASHDQIAGRILQNLAADARMQVELSAR